MTKRRFLETDLFNEFMDKPFDKDEQPIEFYLEQFKSLLKGIANLYLGLAENAGYEFADLEQIGKEALQRAYQRFDPNRKRRNRASGSIGHFFSYTKRTVIRSIEREIFSAAGLPSGYRAKNPKFQHIKPITQLSLETLDDEGLLPSALIDAASPEERLIEHETKQEQLALVRMNLHKLSTEERFIVEGLINGIPLEDLENALVTQKEGKPDRAKSIFNRAAKRLRATIQKAKYLNNA